MSNDCTFEQDRVKTHLHEQTEQFYDNNSSRRITRLQTILSGLLSLVRNNGRTSKKSLREILTLKVARLRPIDYIS